MILYYIGMDIHKKTIAFCIKKLDGTVIDQGTIAANRQSLKRWVQSLPTPWAGAMESTIFTGWIYDFLKPYAENLKVANPQMLKAIAASKKKNDRIDAQKIADLLRCDLLPGVLYGTTKHSGIEKNFTVSQYDGPASCSHAE